MREKYESLSLATLKDLAKARGLKGVSALRKPELIERMLHEDELEGQKNRKQSGRNRSRVKWKVTERESPSITKHRNVHSIMPRQRQYSLTVEREQTESLRYFRMDMGLSDVRIIFRGKMIFMYHLPRSADLT